MLMAKTDDMVAIVQTMKKRKIIQQKQFSGGM
jgi:hypothetical protein